MANETYNIYYLFGAGASAQKWVNREDKLIPEQEKRHKFLPLAWDFGVAIEYLIRDYLTSQNISFADKIVDESLKDFAKFIKQHNTIDEAMRQKYLDWFNGGGVKDPNFQLYNNYKNLISLLFFYIEHNMISDFYRDKRYSQLFLTLMNNDYTMPSNIKLLSWNYDNQVEYALKEINNSMFEKAQNPQLLFKINGTAHFFQLSTVQTSDANMSAMQLRTNEFEEQIKKQKNNSILFAWEEPTEEINMAANLEKYLDSLVKDKKSIILVVIGYSFPYVNHKYDVQILEKLSPEKIYFQDKIATEEKCKELGERFGKKYEFIPISTVDRFYIPGEMYDSFSKKKPGPSPEETIY